MDHKARWNGCDVYLHRGDITALDVDAVVNAANRWLAGGGGVDGAIHDAGGPAIMAQCEKAMADRGGLPLEPGEVVATTAGDLPAKKVLHTAGPVYGQESDPQRAAEFLAACYRHSLALARQLGLRSVAFPCISTGVYGYPPDEACPVAVRAVREDLERHGGIDRVVFCTFKATDFRLYGEALTGGPS